MSDNNPVQAIAGQRSVTAVVLVMVTFLAISIITNVMGPIFPALKYDFHISNSITALFPFFFFIAYGVMSIPAGLISERFGIKRTMLSAFLLTGGGSLLLVLSPGLTVALMSLFCIGCAMAFLQVVINPLLRVSGGEEHYAFFSTLAQSTFAIGGMLAPVVYTAFVDSLAAENANFAAMLLSPLVPDAMPWLSMYWLFLLIALVLFVAVWQLRLPDVTLNDDERIGGFELCRQLFSDKTVLLFFVGIMAYVGAEVGTTTSMSLFLQNYHNLDPEHGGAEAIAHFWTSMAFGCVLGLAFMKVMDSRKVLLLFSILAISAYLTAMFASLDTALIAYSCVGFFMSVMFPAIFSLGLNSVREHHGSVAGILCTGIAGGALVPVIVGLIADISGSYRLGALFVLVPLSYVLSISLWAKPLVANQTLKLFKRDKSLASL